MVLQTRYQFFIHLGLAATALGSGQPTQHPLSDSVTSNAYPRLNFSSPSPHIFHSTFSLFQQWPNSFFPAGHSIVPCTIPKHTNLYHSRVDDTPPPSPDWFAFDGSFSYALYGTRPESHLYTYRTTRDVRCLYFDGTSATMQYDGSLDSQNLVLYNTSANIPDDPVYGSPDHSDHSHVHSPFDFDATTTPNLIAEFERAAGLCNLIKQHSLGGPGWGFEGIVRAHGAFELIWCNFSSPSAQLVNRLNVASLPTDPCEGFFRTGCWRVPFEPHSYFEFFRTASHNDGSVGGVPGAGEIRIQPDICTLFTLYDPALLDESLARHLENMNKFNLSSYGYWNGPQNSSDSRAAALHDLGWRRRYQRTMNVSEADGQYLHSTLIQRMRDFISPSETQGTSCSGIDWVTVSKTIVGEYSSQLFDLKSLLLKATFADISNAATARHRLSLLRGTLHQFYMPYYEYPHHTTNYRLYKAFSTTSPNSLEALGRCKNQHTPLPNTPLSPSERLTVQSILDVLSGLCTTILPLFLSTEILWHEHFTDRNRTIVPELGQKRLNETVATQLQHTEELMAWLGWSEQWIEPCSPACGVGQICAIPLWPMMYGKYGITKKPEWPLADKEDMMFNGRGCVDIESVLEEFAGLW